MLLSLSGRRVYFDLAGPANAPVVCFTHSLAADGGNLDVDGDLTAVGGIDITAGGTGSIDMASGSTFKAVSGGIYLSANDVGSNAVAVAPSHMADGKGYLSVNSHQPIEGRFAWYEAHVNSEEGWNMIGGLFQRKCSKQYLSFMG